MGRKTICDLGELEMVKKMVIRIRGEIAIPHVHPVFRCDGENYGINSVNQAGST